jgi:DNA-binding SARP family transcriptional activator
LAQYETCRRVLARDLDVEPAAETTALYKRIRDEDRR